MSNRNVLKICAMLLIAIFLAYTGHSPALASDHSYKSYSTAKEEHSKKSAAGTHEKSTTVSKEEHGKVAAVAKETHATAAATSSAHEIQSVSAEDALKKLMDGNKRYVEGKLSNPRRNSERRTEVAKGQHPIAVVLSCSDSRVPPEVIFDQGLGDLFVVRTAGHVADEMAIGSIEYAVEHLGAQLIMVIGHKRCGAVDATVKSIGAPAHKEGEVCNICSIVDAIKPAVEKVKDRNGDLLDNSVKANVKLVAEKLRSSKPVLFELAGDGLLKVVGGYYDLDSGAVTLTYNPCMVAVRE